jgi:chemotaxis protein methyltransferase CheR
VTIGNAEFQFVRELVMRETAIVLEPGREYLVESRLTTLARREGFQGLEHLLAKARAERDSRLLRLMVEAMTTNETSFFRDAAYFEAMKRSVLPALIERRRSEQKLSIWCAAASSGQEPYSIAMLLKELAPALGTIRPSLIATDYCQSMLKRCQDGAYSQLEVNRGLPSKLLLAHFERHGTEFRVKDELRKSIDFRQLNLAAPGWPTLPPMDVVFLRNVLIYFNQQTKKDILAKVKRILRSDGVLVLGSTETTINVDTTFERFEVDKAVFYRLRET